MAVGVAVVATLVAVCASAVALWTVTRSNATGGDLAAPAVSERAEPGSGAPGAGTASPAAAAAASPATTASAAAQYALHYEQQELKVPPVAVVCGGTYVDVDVDLPQVQNGSADLTRRNCYTPDALTFGESTASLNAKPGGTAAECVDQIRRAPVTKGSQVPLTSLQPGSALCLRTSQKAAVQQGIPQRVVLVQIGGVDAKSVLTISLTAWDVPE